MPSSSGSAAGAARSSGAGLASVNLLRVVLAVVLGVAAAGFLFFLLAGSNDRSHNLGRLIDAVHGTEVVQSSDRVRAPPASKPAETKPTSGSKGSGSAGSSSSGSASGSGSKGSGSSPGGSDASTGGKPVAQPDDGRTHMIDPQSELARLEREWCAADGSEERQPCRCPARCQPCDCAADHLRSCCTLARHEPSLRVPKADGRRIVVHAIDVKGYYFGWYLPVVALMWTVNMNWRPVFLLFYPNDSPNMHPAFELIVRYVEAAGGDVIHVKEQAPPLYHVAMVLMTARYFAGALDYDDDVYAMLSDTDMFPLSRQFFDDNTSFEKMPDKRVHLLFANAYGAGPAAPYWPSCYIGMRMRDWRSIMQVERNDSLVRSVMKLADERLFARNPAARDSMFEQFVFDQHVFGEILHQRPEFPGAVHFVSRDTSRDRLDRANNAGHFSLDAVPNAVESHVVRPAFLDANWAKIRDLAARKLSGAHMEFVDEFAAAFCRFLGCLDVAEVQSAESYDRPR